jgi:hypothetical protein
MTPFAALAALAGLSQQEAADYLRVRLDTVKSWSRGRNPAAPRAGVIDEMCALIRKQEAMAERALEAIRDRAASNARPGVVELGAPVLDEDAQRLGLPCCRAWGAVAARVIARSPIPVAIVPRGTTAATAAAADIHDDILGP